MKNCIFALFFKLLSNKMKKVLFALALFVSISVHAQSTATVEGATFGATYDETLTALKGTLGEPSSKSDDKLVYLNKDFEGFKANRVELGFQDLSASKKFNQARFYFVCVNKAAAVAKMKAIAKKMESKYTVSYDIEDEGMEFYKGGQSPLGIGSLFTIFVSPYLGKWTCQVRYGSFHFKA